MLSKTSKGGPPLLGHRTNICDLGWKKSRFVLIHSLRKCKEDYHLIENIPREKKNNVRSHIEKYIRLELVFILRTNSKIISAGKRDRSLDFLVPARGTHTTLLN